MQLSSHGICLARLVIQDDDAHRRLPISGRHADIRDFCLTALTVALTLKEDKASKLLPQGNELADCVCGVTDCGARGLTFRFAFL